MLPWYLAYAALLPLYGGGRRHPLEAPGVRRGRKGGLGTRGRGGPVRPEEWLLWTLLNGLLAA